PVPKVPTLPAVADPLSGPLSGSEPMLAPLLDPTIHEHDPLGVDHLVGPSRHRAAPEPEPEPEQAIEDGWAAEWASGSWAPPEPDQATPAAVDHEPDAVPAADPPPRERGPRPTPVQRPVDQAAARLSEADRELLARLQAELVAGRKPRVPRRPAPASGQPASNGVADGRENPPDSGS
ncbi:MAG: hypothetical protein L0H84_06145, partial [Pseudonocardia sp.]|nr:hypothetical protein [Pseudonocardia sp.]